MANRNYKRKNGGRKSKYTSAQRKAYETGKAYRLGQNGKAINFKNEENKQSFYAGYRAVNLDKYVKSRVLYDGRLRTCRAGTCGIIFHGIP